MLPKQNASMRADVAVRVFRIKIEALAKDIYASGVFGRPVARLYVIEFQKRGRPHAHIPFMLPDEDAPNPTDDYDSIVSAVIPGHDKEPSIWNTMTTSTMHGPCGAINPKSPRMEGGACAKGYHMRSREATVDVDGSPEYRGPEDGRSVAKNGFPMTNQWVAPYNPWLCAKYDAHINVEVCSTISPAKYLYKHAYKGPDRAAVKIGNDVWKSYLGGRYFPAQEGRRRLLDFDIRGKYHTVARPQVHLAGDQIAHFRGDELIEDIAARPGKDTALTELPEANSGYPEADTGVNYRDFPKYFA